MEKKKQKMGEEEVGYRQLNKVTRGAYRHTDIWNKHLR